MKNKNGILSVASRNIESLKGYLFLIPALYGIFYFFLIPVIKSFLFSIGVVSSTDTGYSITITGMDAYVNALYKHTSYRQDVVTTFIDVLTTTPLIIIYSFFMASLLNQEFKGRTFFRVVFFLPVIVSTISNTNVLEMKMGSLSGFKDTFTVGTVSVTQQISDWLINAGVATETAQSLISLANKVYGIIDLSGVQILILLVGMQSIAPALYEAAVVEGATAWERFWKITFPLITPLLFTCIIYTVVDSFTRSSNLVMGLISRTAFSANPNFPLASAMGWIYFLIIAIFLGVVALIFSRMIHFDDMPVKEKKRKRKVR